MELPRAGVCSALQGPSLLMQRRASAGCRKTCPLKKDPSIFRTLHSTMQRGPRLTLAVKGQQNTIEDEATADLSNPDSAKNSVGHSGDPRLPEADDDLNPPANNYLLTAGIAAAVALLVGAGVFYHDDIKSFLDIFVADVESLGPLGYVVYAVVYTVLEILAVPAAPLTLAAGYLFGSVAATAVVSVSATVAAVSAFLISRYLLRDKVLEWANDNKTFAAVDKALKKDAFKCVFLLRLSPLMPFAASNYLYGLTSIDLGPYTLGSWLGMLPGTFAYVSAGSVGRTLTEGAPGSGGGAWQQLAAGVVLTICAITFIGRLATTALKEIEEEEEAEAAAREAAEGGAQ